MIEAIKAKYMGEIEDLYKLPICQEAMKDPRLFKQAVEGILSRMYLEIDAAGPMYTEEQIRQAVRDSRKDPSIERYEDKVVKALKANEKSSV